ncbi:PREDICTED: uncharacterized protein LOC108558682 [Nicrophorus vespilloides]|uniref:Uncharacterized protein LOC108558682 n=1 Tax=Nicrophorus vespilloides TaxID=110193 RepID=A0ABM1M9A8_NICVS|nr:PREDICTED: uncharacterized protein LOC108558682 [Nicrophorus vespilloides]
MELFDYEVEIKLDKNNIHPREDISGNVKIKVQTALFLTHAYIEITGRAVCCWKQKKHIFSSRKRSFTGEEEFFYCRHTLAGNDGTEVIMEKRSYYYPFKCKLPGHLPATWHGQYGLIQYVAQVVIKSDEECIGKHSKEITIIPYRNLRYEPYLLIEAKKTVKRTYHFGFLKMGTVTVTIWLPLCGISAGQNLPLICTIDNKSSVLFGGIVFILTQIQIYRSSKPKYTVKTIRTDICRVARMADILKGVQEYYCVLKTDSDIFPTTQYWRCSTCQLVYEVWAQLQGSLPTNNAYGYPNVDVPGIPIIVGTDPLCNWNINEINDQVMRTLLRVREPIVMDPPPPDEVVEEILNTVDDEFDVEMMSNLTKQININESGDKQKQ